MEPALKQVREKIVGGLLTPRTRPGDCFKFTNALAAQAEALGVRFPIRQHHPWCRRGTAAVSRASSRRMAASRPMPWSWRSAASRRFWYVRMAFACRLSGEGLLADHSDHRRGACAGLHRDGRDLQDRHHAARRSYPRRRHGGNLRLHQRSGRSAPPDAAAFRHRPFFPAATCPRRASGPACDR